MMTMFTMTAVLIGAVLGQRFKVLILGPAIVISLAAIIAFAIALHNSLWSTLFVMALITTALQIGYLGGIVTRFVIAAARVGRDSRGTIAAAQRSAR
jgi:hypothetical protein